MSDDLWAAKNYLTPAPTTFWRWRDGGEVVAWAEGATIVFRRELAQVLARLAPNGLPPLGAVLLVLAATRTNWREDRCGPTVLAGMTEKLDGQSWKRELVTDVARGLERVSRLPDKVRATTAARAELAGLVFEECSPRTSPGVAAAVVRLLEQGLPEEVVVPGEAPRHGEAPTVFWYELRSLRYGLNRLDAEALSLRRKTGLDEVVGPAKVDLTPAERARSLIAELEDDDELSGVGRLARHLMAAVTLPRAVSDREDLPLGGISDISNRGPLDRLLLSELAHDDLTLAVRVATGEALYLRREQPPRTPPRERVLFLESGIRSWGVPRVFAAAVALALTATTDAHTSVTSYRARGAGVVEVDLTTRQGLVDHLGTLEPEPHPGAALRPLLAILDEREMPHDLVLITAEDVLADRNFQRALAACEPWPLHVATVRRDGRFELLLCGARGRKSLSTATLDLDGLFASKKTKKTQLIDKRRAPDLPAILTQRPFPLRVPPPGVVGANAWFVQGLGVFSVARDRRLVLWTDRTRGPRQITEDLPCGGLLWASPAYRGGVVKAVLGNLQQGDPRLLTIRVDEGRCSAVVLERSGHDFRGVCSTASALFLIYTDRADVFDLEGGRRLPAFRFLPGLRWAGGRFFHDLGNRSWYVLGFDGLSPRHDPVLDVRQLNGRPLAALFERRGLEGAIGVTAAGDLYFSATQETKGVPHGLAAPVEVMAIARNGERIVLGGKTSSGLHYQCGLDVASGVASPWLGDPFSFTERFTEYGSTASLRNHFSHVGTAPGGGLALRSQKGELLAIRGDGMGALRLLHVSPPVGELPKRAAFQPTAGPPFAGYTLKVATWPDGSRAFLDSRGLLHLMSANLSIPETSLVLSNGLLAGWCADGCLWGSSYFHEPGPPTAEPQTILDILNAFARQLP
jgi:hypothetical protein